MEERRCKYRIGKVKEKVKKRTKERERVERAQNKARIALEYLYEYYSATNII